MSFDIKRKDEKQFRNFSVSIGDLSLIGRNEDFYAELSEWIDGVLVLMKNGSSYFSAQTGFTPFFGTISGHDVEFETVDGKKVKADFLDVVTNTIIFLYEQSLDEALSERDCDFFYRKGNLLLAGYRFRYKDRYKGFVEYLKSRQLYSED